MSRAGSDKDAFRLRAGEPLGDAVRRIARHEIDVVIDELDGKLDDDAIHEVRKATKRLRALLRLVRDQLGERVYRRENQTFRDAARALSPTRDTEVLVATIDGLVERYGDGGHPRVFSAFRRAARERLRTADHGDGGRTAKKRIIAAMRRARTRCARWTIEDDGWDAIAPAVRRIYQRGRGTWRDARATPSVPHLHEWRKRTKDLRYVLELLEPVWPEVMHAYAGEVDDLGDKLGQDHDHAMLRRFVLEQAEHNGGDPQAILAVIDATRRDLQARAWTLALKTYEATPRRFLRRLATYWRAWEAEEAARDGAGSATASV
jgi:CHAD domain-containing protein